MGRRPKGDDVPQPSAPTSQPCTEAVAATSAQAARDALQRQPATPSAPTSQPCTEAVAATSAQAARDAPRRHESSEGGRGRGESQGRGQGGRGGGEGQGRGQGRVSHRGRGSNVQSGGSSATPSSALSMDELLSTLSACSQSDRRTQGRGEPSLASHPSAAERGARARAIAPCAELDQSVASQASSTNLPAHAAASSNPRARGQGRHGVTGAAGARERAGAGRRGGDHANRWWRNLSDVDPISLEPLSKLAHAPFALLADETVSRWFDPQILSSYLISSANFTHPISRRELTRADRERLDAHCAASRLPRFGVADAFDHRIEFAAAAAVAAAADAQAGEHGGGAGASRIASRQQEATAVMRALFAARDAPSAGSRGEGGAAAGRARGLGQQLGARHNVLSGGELHAMAACRAPASQPSSVAFARTRGGAPVASAREGNLTLVDDDLARHPDAHPAFSGPASVSLLFPPLPAPAPPPPRVEVARPPPRAAPTPATLTAANQTTAGDAEARRRQLADAFNIANPQAHASMFANTAVSEFSEDVLALARANPALVARVESSVDSFLASSDRRYAFEPMPRRERALVHEAARKYGLVTASYGDDPHRRVDIFRTDRQGWPSYRLSDAALASKGASATTGAAVASGDAAASSAWVLHFCDVESAEAVYGLLGACREDVVLTWTKYGDAKGHKQPVAGTAVFTTRAAYHAVRDRAGGGLRGAYRVV